MLRLAIVTGSTNIPNPPRTTVPGSFVGLQAKPTRGLIRCDVLWYTALSLGVANVNPPGTLNELSCGIGFFAYAASAAAAIGLGVVVSNPFTVRAHFSRTGPSWSKCSPRFSVRFDFARQSSCTNPAP